MKSIIKVLIILLLPMLLFAQNTNWQISGIVIEKGKTPVPFANVFVNNTSIGTSTDINGQFTLKIPSKIQKIELVISFVGYTTLKRIIFKKDIKFENFVFILQNGLELNEVKVIAKHDKDWRKKWKLFSHGLLGDSEFYGKCEILNPEVIKLEFDQHKKLIATATEPILIQNNAFGLKITFQMERFETDGQQTFLSGFKFFEQLDASSNEKKWTRNKKRAYNDSFRNFLVSLSQRKLKENGFEIFKVLQVKSMYFGRTTVSNEIYGGALAQCEAEDICTYDSTTQQFILHSDYPIQVFSTKRYVPLRVYADYPYAYSIVDLINKYTVFTGNGWLTKPNGILIKGFWGNEGFANLLPEDYFPENTEQDSTVFASNPNTLAVISSKGFKADTLVKELAFQGIIYDKKVEVSEEKKDFALISNDINVKISENDYNISIYILLQRIPGLVAAPSNVHFIGSNTNLGGGGGLITPALMYDGTFITDEATIYNILDTINVREIKSLGAVKYGNSAIFGSRGGLGTIVITTKK